MFIYIHLVQYSRGIDTNFTAETKLLCNAFVTARAGAIHLRATVGLLLASILLVWHQPGASPCHYTKGLKLFSSLGNTLRRL